MSSKLLAGRYELIEKIGEGGMAIVYKAKCRLLNRYVAIKILRPEFTKDEQFVENFRRESQAAASLQHPNIVAVYDVGKEGDIHFIVMELIDGRPLSEIIKERAPMDYKLAIEITRQIASALSVAHKNNIIHRDVKPHNIMITNDGIAKLGDFGIAKAVSDSTLVTETSKIIGSVHYFSPEQARGSYVDERSDIYSLGIVLYEMLTGQVPFDGDNPVQVALMHINDDITPPSKLVGGIPPTLEKLVMKATDKFQSNRYKTADELIEEIDNIEFVTKMVGNSIFAASDVEEFQEMNRENKRDYNKKPKVKEKKASAEESSNKGNGSKKVIIGIIAAVVVIGAVIGGLFAFGILGGGKSIEAPDLTNMTYEEAQTEVAKYNLKIEKGDEVPSADVEKGKIASQTPLEGTKVKEGDTITVNISSGKETDLLPNLVGQQYNYDQTKAYLESLGFQLGSVSEAQSDKYEKGIIISQSPSGNSEAEQGTIVSIVVSSGKKDETATVPSLTGLNLDAAKKAITDAGFSIGTITYEESEAYGKNYVMGQSLTANTKQKKGSAINIVVSKGAPVIPDPDDGSDNNSSSDGSES